MVAAGKRLAAIFKAALPVTNQLADCLSVDMAVFVLAGETK